MILIKIANAIAEQAINLFRLEQNVGNALVSNLEVIGRSNKLMNIRPIPYHGSSKAIVIIPASSRSIEMR